MERIEIAPVLQKRTASAGGALIVQRGAVDEIALHVLRVEAVVQQVGRRGPLVGDDVAQQDVADSTGQGGAFAHDVQPEQRADIARQRALQEIGALTERVIDVDDDCVAPRQAIEGGQVGEPSIEPLGRSLLSSMTWASTSGPSGTCSVVMPAACSSAAKSRAAWCCWDRSGISWRRNRENFPGCCAPDLT